jgi:hypothetical protein
MTELKKQKRIRFWLRLLFITVAYIIPFTILAFRFDFLQFKEAEVKVSGVVILLGVLLLFQFRKEVQTWIESWEFSLSKVILLGLGKVWAFLLALGVITLAKYGINNIEFIVGWISIPQIVAYLFIKPFSEQADYLIKKEIRKSEVKEALTEYNTQTTQRGRKTGKTT